MVKKDFIYIGGGLVFSTWAFFIGYQLCKKQLDNEYRPRLTALTARITYLEHGITKKS